MARLDLSLFTTLSAHDCLTRLREVTLPEQWFPPRSATPRVFLRSDQQGARLRLQVPRARYSRALLLHASFEPATGGTIIRLRFRLPAYERAFWALWLGGSMAFSMGVLVAALLQHPERWLRLLLLLPLLFIMPGIGYVFWRWSLRTGRKESEQLLKLLRDTVQARDL